MPRALSWGSNGLVLFPLWSDSLIDAFLCRWTWLHSVRFGLYNRRTTGFSSLSRSMPVRTPDSSQGRREKVLGWQWTFHCAGWGQSVWHRHHEGKSCFSASVSEGRSLPSEEGKVFYSVAEKEEVLFPRRWGSSSHCNIWWAVEIDRGLERLYHISLWSYQKPDLESSGDSSRYLPVMLEALGWISSTAYRSGMVAHSCTPSTWEQRQEDEKFSYPWCLVSQKSAWPIWGPTLVS